MARFNLKGYVPSRPKLWIGFGVIVLLIAIFSPTLLDKIKTMGADLKAKFSGNKVA